MPTALTLLDVLLIGVAALLSLPVLVLSVEIFSACGARWLGSAASPSLPDPARRPSVAVLVPAHNEVDGIAATIQSIRAQLVEGDRCVVIADNCTDETARVAGAAGATVVERTDAARRGKGFALDHGVKHLAAEPPEVVVVIDADCTLGPNAIDLLARRCIETARPVQGSNVMRSPPGAPLKTRIAEFAFVIRTVRARGCFHLGLPCQLTGTGMAFPWPLIRDASLASAHIVEDLRLGLELAAEGSPPTLCPGATVLSVFPLGAAAFLSQRVRWEQGHFGVIAELGPRLMWRAIRRGQLPLAAMVADLCVPPVAALVLAHCAVLALSGDLGDQLRLDRAACAGGVVIAPDVDQCRCRLEWLRSPCRDVPRACHRAFVCGRQAPDVRADDVQEADGVGSHRPEGRCALKGGRTARGTAP